MAKKKSKKKNAKRAKKVQSKKLKKSTKGLSKKQIGRKRTKKQAMTAKAPKKVANKKTSKPKDKQNKQEKKQAKPEEKPKQSKLKLFLANAGHALKTKYRNYIIVAFALLGVFVIFQVSSLVLAYSLRGLSLPNTQIAGINVSSLKLDEIQQKLMDKGQPFLETPIKIKLGDRTEEFLPEELGIKLMPRNTLKEVKFVDPGKTNLFDIIGALWVKQDIAFAVSIDITKAIENIEQRLEFSANKPKNAYLTFEENDLIIVPQKDGQEIITRTLYQDLKNASKSLSSDAITLQTEEKSPLVKQENLEAELDSIKGKLDQDIYLIYETWDFKINLMDHIEWVRFDYKDQIIIGDLATVPVVLESDILSELPESIRLEKSLWIEVEKASFMQYIDEEISPIIESEPQDVKIFTDENGKVVIEGKGTDGRTIRDDFLTNSLTLAVNNEIEDAPMAVLIQKGNVDVSDDLRMLGIETLIGTGRSGFAGSTNNRIHNIDVGIERFSGELIPPGVEYSFNERLGPVDASTGYRPELVIKAEGTIPEYGGGLCQVSSTMYRAALWTGLPITERMNHSYAVSYYAQIFGYGLDATIYPGIRDLVFVNDTQGHILIHAYTEGTEAFFKFYGTDDGRSVEMEGPYKCCYRSPGPAQYIPSASLPAGATKQVEYGHTGFDTTWYRYLSKDGETAKETIYSNYQAIPAKILTGPAVVAVEE